ncbi:MAG: hypothetical protein Q4B75_00845 [Eubacteriales bacterium]|nr:hypothetical protein [Eubacteriales bacterium]
MEIAENIGLYYNEGKVSARKKFDDPEQAEWFLTIVEEAEQLMIKNMLV